MAGELGERTEHPTGRRLAQARSEGQIAKSQEFGAAVEMLGAVIVVMLLGPDLFKGCATLMRDGLSPKWLTAAPVTELRSVMSWTALKQVVMVGPMVLLFALIAALSQFLQVGWLWTLKPIMPKWGKLNPVNGLKRLLGKRGLVKSIVSSVKVLIILWIAYAVISSRLQTMAFLPALSGVAALAEMGDIVFDVIVWLLSLLLVIGVADLLYHRWQRLRDLRMTKQEVKEERKSMEGDEQTKARRLRMARTMLLQKMRQGVQTADVIVTNPTHFAVAIKYDADSMHAPKVVAKGADFMAFRIREMANIYGVPIVERPPLARALYAGVDVGRSISPQFYEAVAELLAFVYRLKAKAA